VTRPLRIALLDHDYGGRAQPAGRLASGLAATGHAATVIAPRSLPDLPLRLRKIGERPGRLPGTYLTLRLGDWDVAHAFTPQDAAAAVRWSRATGRPCVFTCVEPLRRERLADRRLRLALLRRAVEETDAVIAPDPEVAASLRRWMAVAPCLIDFGCAGEHVALYRELVARRTLDLG
jgi:hypothetical protein